MKMFKTQLSDLLMWKHILLERLRFKMCPQILKHNGQLLREDGLRSPEKNGYTEKLKKCVTYMA